MAQDGDQGHAVMIVMNLSTKRQEFLEQLGILSIFKFSYRKWKYKILK
jgi:hypothetical protein